MRSLVPVALLLGSLLAASGSAAAPALPIPETASDTSGADWSSVPEYRIVPGDRLQLNLGPRLDVNQDLIRTVVVRPDGRISVYPIGDVIAAGSTPMELQRVLIDLLSVDLREPRVTVEVIELAGNQVHVFGRVVRPNSYTATPFMTVMQAITAAGGFENDAARNSVLVFHRDGSRTLRVTRVRMDRVMKGRDLEDVRLHRFDIVYVPRSTIGNIDVFARQFFGEPTQMLQAGLTGWQLFNIDRIFVTRVERVDQ